MAGFGGSVKLTGEQEYRKALTQITQSLKAVSAEMKASVSSFDAGDKSAKQLANDAKTLKSALEQEKSAFSALKGQLSAMQSEYSKSASAHEKLVKEYETEKSKLSEIEKTLGKGSEEYKKQAKVVNDLGQEVASSEKKLDAQGKAMTEMRTKTANAEVTINQTAKSMDELGEETDDTRKKTEKAGDGFTVFKGILANLATQAITACVDGLKKLGGAMINVGKQAVGNYASYEQLVGGIETLFGDSADIMLDYANNAYKTAGLSANEYMEQATSFSASLLQGLGGDTLKATQYTDMAIKDMADNANKMGTSMDSIEHAYQGFAKQNYTINQLSIA